MPIILKTLNNLNFQAHATASVVYTAPAGGAEVATLWIHNQQPSAVADVGLELFWPVTASLGSDSGSYRRLSETFKSGITLELSPKVPVILQSGQSIWARAQQSASINISLTGIER